jgi:hypothetical protein
VLNASPLCPSVRVECRDLVIGRELIVIELSRSRKATVPKQECGRARHCAVTNAVDAGANAANANNFVAETADYPGDVALTYLWVTPTTVGTTLMFEPGAEFLTSMLRN